MDKLGKMSLLICLVGIIALFFITENFEFSLKGINNISENKDIKLKAEVINVNKYDETIVFNLKTECYVNGFYYDKDNKFNKTQIIELKNKYIEITGNAMTDFNPKISIESLMIS